MLAMALLLPGGHLGGLGGNAREVGGSGEGVLTPPTVPDGFRWGVETGELTHLLNAVASIATGSRGRIIKSDGSVSLYPLSFGWLLLPV